MALAAKHDMELQQMDVDTAYLNAPVGEEIYMRQPRGKEQAGAGWGAAGLQAAKVPVRTEASSPQLEPGDTQMVHRLRLHGQQC